MKLKQILVAGASVLVLGGCDLTATPSPSGSPSATPSPAVNVVYAVNFNSSTPTNTLLHEVTVANGKATDRVVLSNQQLTLTDARDGMALVSLNSPIPGGNGAESNTLATVDLASGVVHSLGVQGLYGIGGLLSPDGTQAAVDTTDSNGDPQLLIVQIPSGTSLVINASQSAAPSLSPVRWNAQGLFVTKSYPEGAPTGIYSVDLQSGALTTVSTATDGALSPTVKFQASSSNVDLGDVACNCLGGWYNTLTTNPVGGASTTIASEKNRSLGPLDVSDNGSVLYTLDGDPNSLSADAGLYFYTNSTGVLQLPTTIYGEWRGGKLVGPTTAVVARYTTASTGINQVSIEVDLAQLCGTSTGCQSQLSPIFATTGQSPIVTLVVVPS